MVMLEPWTPVVCCLQLSLGGVLFACAAVRDPFFKEALSNAIHPHGTTRYAIKKLAAILCKVRFPSLSLCETPSAQLKRYAAKCSDPFRSRYVFPLLKMWNCGGCKLTGRGPSTDYAFRVQYCEWQCFGHRNPCLVMCAGRCKLVDRRAECPQAAPSAAGYPAG